MKSIPQKANSARNANRYTNIQDAIKLIKDNSVRALLKELYSQKRGLHQENGGKSK
ncbi:MAG: hypothetical protein QXP36_11460 [Conexivisphaerales archaeon]